MPEGGTFANQIQTEWMYYNCFVLWCVSGSMAPLACVWHEEQFYTAGSMPEKDVDGLADGNLWVSMPLSQNRFTMLTHISFLAFGLSINIPLTLLYNQLGTCIINAQSALCIMANCMCTAFRHSSASPC